MKRYGLLTVASALLLLTANCSNESNGGGQGLGGSATTTNATGGSPPPTSGGAGGSSSGSGGSSGVGGTTTTATRADAAVDGREAGGGAGGATTGTSRRDAGTDANAGTGGPGGGGGSTARGGATGSGGTTRGGGTTGGGGTGSGGRTGSGGTTGSGGSVAIDGGSTDGGGSAVLPSAGCGKPAGLTSGRGSIETGGKTREYILTLPANYDPNHAYKLVFGWHPWTGSAQQVSSSRYFGLQTEATNEAIFVAGEGLDYQNQGLGWGNAGGEDIAFYHAMADRFRSQLCIDENRMFSTGFSFGAMFSFTLGCEADSMMRAIVPMAGNTTTSGGCAAGTRPVAVLALIGVDDTLLSGHRQAVQTYARRNGCTTEKVPADPTWCTGLAQSYLPCTCVSYQGCKEGYPVMECEYKAGHQAAPNPGPIWDFLAQF
jgi:polyhydroxybutyrate depolymerase